MKQCPISKERSDLYIDRIEAFIAALGIAFFAITCTVVAPLVLMVDYFVKIATKNRTGLFRPLSIMCKKLLGLGENRVDDAPKHFARVLAAIMMVNLVVMYLLDLHGAAVFLSILFVSFAMLEALFGFCVGCRIYALAQRARSL